MHISSLALLLSSAAFARADGTYGITWYAGDGCTGDVVGMLYISFNYPTYPLLPSQSNIRHIANDHHYRHSSEHDWHTTMRGHDRTSRFGLLRLQRQQ